MRCVVFGARTNNSPQSREGSGNPSPQCWRIEVPVTSMSCLILQQSCTILTTHRVVSGLLTDGNKFHFLKIRGTTLSHSVLERKESLPIVFNALCSMFMDEREIVVEPCRSDDVENEDECFGKHGKRKRINVINPIKMQSLSPPVTTTTTITTPVPSPHDPPMMCTTTITTPVPSPQGPPLVATVSVTSSTVPGSSVQTVSIATTLPSSTSSPPAGVTTRSKAKLTDQEEKSKPTHKRNRKLRNANKKR